MSIPTLERRPTHRLLPLLGSEISRITHRRLFRVLALLLLGGIALISTIVFFVSSNDSGWSEDRILEEQAAQQGYWEECAASLPDGKNPERRCGPTPVDQPLQQFNYGGDNRYHAYRNLPVVILGVTIAAAAVAFLMGASSGGAEWASRSMTLQLLFEPRRLRLLTVKWLGLCLGITVLAAVSMALALAFGAVTASARGSWDPKYLDVPGDNDSFAQVLTFLGLRGLVLVVIAATLGYAIAMLVRNTGASLGVAFVYFVVVENIVRFALLKYGTQPFLVAENSIAFMVPGGIPVQGRVEEGQFLFEEDTFFDLTNMRAFLTLMVYTALLSIPAAWSFTRRDVS